MVNLCSFYVRLCVRTYSFCTAMTYNGMTAVSAWVAFYFVLFDFLVAVVVLKYVQVASLETTLLISVFAVFPFSLSLALLVSFSHFYPFTLFSLLVLFSCSYVIVHILSVFDAVSSVMGANDIGTVILEVESVAQARAAGREYVHHPLFLSRICSIVKLVLAVCVRVVLFICCIALRMRKTVQ